MRKLTLLVSLFTLTILFLSCGEKKNSSDKSEMIKSYCLDFNWGEGGPNAFAEPGLWADANPQEHIKWYKDLGVKNAFDLINGIKTYAKKNGFSKIVITHAPIIYMEKYSNYAELIRWRPDC